MQSFERCGVKAIVVNTSLSLKPFGGLPETGDAQFTIRITWHLLDELKPDWRKGWASWTPPFMSLLNRLSQEFAVSTRVREYYRMADCTAVVSTHAPDRFVVFAEGRQLTAYCAVESLYGILGDLFLTSGRISPIHASAATANGETQVFMGEHGAGKTGRLLALLETGGEFIADDSLIWSPGYVKGGVEYGISVHPWHIKTWPQIASFISMPPQRESNWISIDNLLRAFGTERRADGAHAVLHYLDQQDGRESPLSGIRQVFPGLIRHSMWCHDMLGVSLDELHESLKSVYSALRKSVYRVCQGPHAISGVRRIE